MCYKKKTVYLCLGRSGGPDRTGCGIFWSTACCGFKKIGGVQCACVSRTGCITRAHAAVERPLSVDTACAAACSHTPGVTWHNGVSRSRNMDLMNLTFYRTSRLTEQDNNKTGHQYITRRSIRLDLGLQYTRHHAVLSLITNHHHISQIAQRQTMNTQQNKKLRRHTRRQA